MSERKIRRAYVDWCRRLNSFDHELWFKLPSYRLYKHWMQRDCRGWAA